jgi:WD40 repeat protein
VRKAGTTLGDFLRFSPDGKLLSAAGPGCMAVQVWDVAAKKVVAEVEGPEETLGGVTFRRQVECAAFSPDGKRLAVGCTAGMILLWDVQVRTVVAKFEAPADDRRRVRISSVAFNADRRLLAVGTNFHQVQLWDLQPK